MDAMKYIIQKLALSNDSNLLGKCREYMDNLNSKVPPGCLKKAECARCAIAVEFALKHLQINYDENALCGCSMIPRKEYNAAYIKCKNILQLQFTEKNILDALLMCSENSSNLKQLTNRILELYSTHISQNMDEFQRKHIDLSSAVYIASAFKLACKMSSISIDRKAVLRLSKLDGSYFDKIFEAVLAAVGSHISPTDSSTGVPAPASRKRKVVPLTSIAAMSSDGVPLSKQGRVDIDKKSPPPARANAALIRSNGSHSSSDSKGNKLLINFMAEQAGPPLQLAQMRSGTVVADDLSPAINLRETMDAVADRSEKARDKYALWKVRMLQER